MNKITFSQVQDRIEDVIYQFHKRSVIAIATLKCGHVVVGEAHCQPATEYSEDIGKDEALNRVIDKVFEYEIYLERNKGRIE